MVRPIVRAAFCRAHSPRRSRYWVRELNTYLNALEELFWPQLIIVGGSTSAESPRFEHLLDTQTTVVAAAKGYDAAIIGAALDARRAE